jgi:LysM repeat protein
MKLAHLFFLILLCAKFSSAKTMDSIRAETIKGQKFIIHKVDKSENLNLIVKRYKSTLADVNKHNELKNNKVSKNQIIRIPVYSEIIKPFVNQLNDSSKIDEAHANAQNVEVQKTYTHQVSLGETLNAISKKYKITSAQIVKWNNLKSNKIAAGQILVVDESATVKPFHRLNTPEAQMPLNNQMPLMAYGDLIEQIGIAIIDETMQVLHSDAPIGTIIKVVNLDNNKECLVRVTGKLDASKYNNFVVSIGNEAQLKLDIKSVTARVKISYMVKP